MTTLHLKAVNGGAFNCAPARDVELEDKDILTNDVTLPEESNPHNTRLWVIGNEFGALCAVWSTEHELLDTAVDLDRMDSFDANEEHKECEAMHTDECVNVCEHSCEHALLGNAGEPFDLTYCWYQQVDLSPAENWQLLCRFAEARGAQQDSLWS